MKKSFLLIAFAMVVAILSGCRKEKNTQLPSLRLDSEVEAENDTTVYGKCAETTTMNSLYVVDTKGDTLNFLIDDESIVLGGMLMGDKMAVIGHDVFGETVAQKVINITSLMGRWTSLDKDFELKDGGEIVSYVTTESKTYNSWKILNGKLILAPDTFEVNALGPDSMLLEKNDGIFGFKRQAPKSMEKTR